MTLLARVTRNLLDRDEDRPFRPRYQQRFQGLDVLVGKTIQICPVSHSVAHKAPDLQAKASHAVNLHLPREKETLGDVHLRLGNWCLEVISEKQCWRLFGSLKDAFDEPHGIGAPRGPRIRFYDVG